MLYNAITLNPFVNFKGHDNYLKKPPKPSIRVQKINKYNCMPFDVR